MDLEFSSRHIFQPANKQNNLFYWIKFYNQKCVIRKGHIGKKHIFEFPNGISQKRFYLNS